MKFSATVLSNALLFGTAFAGIAERNERRAANRLRKTTPPIPVTGTAKVDNVLLTNNSDVTYSSNWAGAVLTSPPSGSTFSSVSASFVIPSATGSGAASAWVGIDGDTYTNSILQTGVDFNVENGRVTYDCWYEWYPDYAYDFSGISFSVGDSVSLSVKASSSTSGTAVIENLTTGKTVSKAITSSAALGGQNAEWIVEDFEQNGSLVTLANFGTVTFTGAEAGTSSGETLTPSGAQILDIKQGNDVLTSVESSGSTVTVKHT